MRKAKWNDPDGRVRDVVSDPNNAYIVRDKDAGRIIDGCLVMHNGIRVLPQLYGELVKVFGVNKGVHEPQEERVFAEVLPYIREGGVMIELGANWSFYSMWFYKEVKRALCYLVEPNIEWMERGKENFKLNNMVGDFTLSRIGDDGINIDTFLETKNIKHVDILHSDIQGAEFTMLLGAQKSVRAGMIDYFFISTHNQELHYRCRDFLKRNGFVIIVSADPDYQTYCCDGVLIARRAAISGLEPVNILLADWERYHPFIDNFAKSCPVNLRAPLYQYCNWLRKAFIKWRGPKRQ